MTTTTPFSAAGFDSSLLERPLGFPRTGDQGSASQSGTPFLKATLGVSVRTLDFDAFVRDYLSLMPIAIRDSGGTPKKRIYKSAHLTKQLAAKAPDVIRRLLSSISDRIERIDVYCFYSRREYISIYGTGRGERLSPNEFVELTQNAFPHVCAWRYLENYKADSENDHLMIDHFQGKITPAWEAIEDGSFDIRVFYSGSECNPLISAADLTLRIIETYQRGNLDELSLLKPMEDQVPKLAGKLRFHNLGGPGYCIKAAAPHLPLDFDVSPFIQHPLYLFAWNPGKPRDVVKPAFEWSPIYNSVMELACHNYGNVKFLEFEKDHLFWDVAKDAIIAWTPQDVENLAMLKDIGHELPKILTKDDILKPKDPNKTN